MAKIKNLGKTIDRFNQGCSFLQQAIDAWENKDFLKYETALRKAATESGGALEWVLKIYLRNFCRDRIATEDQPMPKHPNFNDLMTRMQKYAIPPLEVETINQLYGCRNLRNASEHDAAIPSTPELNEAIQTIRQLIITYLLVSTEQLKTVSISVGQPVKIRWGEYCQNLLITHKNWWKNWSGMPSELYISPEEMEIAPAQVILERESNEPLNTLVSIIKQSESPGVRDVLSKLAVTTRFSSVEPTKDFLKFVDEYNTPIMLLGNPGMGKSVALQRVAIQYANRYLNDNTSYIPVLVPLRRYNNRTRNLHYLIRLAMQNKGSLKLTDEEIIKILEAEKLLLLFDGLDEALGDPDIIPALETFIQEYPHHKCVISSRPNAYRQSYDKIAGCEEVTLQPLKAKDAAQLWRKAVDTIDFENLPDEVQNILRIPLLLRLSPYLTQADYEHIKTKAQMLDAIYQALTSTLNVSIGDIVERSLFHLALELYGSNESYLFNRDQVFGIVAEYLSGESIEYQEDKAQEVLRHPLLTPLGSSYFSFWHPAIQEYLTARGLQDAIFARQVSTADKSELLLQYLRDRQWHDTIYYLAEILDDATQLINLLLDFDPLLALNCTHKAKRTQDKDSTIKLVVNELIKAIITAIDQIWTSADEMAVSSTKESPEYVPDVNEDVQIKIQKIQETFLPFLVSNSLLVHLTSTRFKLNKPRLEEFGLGNLVKFIDYVFALQQAITDYKLDTELQGVHLQNLLQSQRLLYRLFGLYWLEVALIFPDTSFSTGFLTAIDEYLPPVNLNPDNINELTMTMRVKLNLLPKIKDEQTLITYWNEFLKVPNTHPHCKLMHTYAALGLLNTEGSQAQKPLYNILYHEEAQVRLIATLGMLKYEQYGEVSICVYSPDPNPIVAHFASVRLPDPLDCIFIDEEMTYIRLLVEALIAPLAAKIPVAMLEEQFLELSTLSVKPDFLVNPYPDQEYLDQIVEALLFERIGSWGDFIEYKYEDLLSAITASI